MLQSRDPQYALQLYNKSKTYLINSEKYNYSYGSFLIDFDIEASMQALEKSSQCNKNPSVFLALGGVYEKMKEWKKAETMYLKAHYMFPLLLQPQENLINLYHRTGQMQKAFYWANNIIKCHIKVINPKAEMIKRNAVSLLELDTVNLGCK